MNDIYGVPKKRLDNNHYYPTGTVGCNRNFVLFSRIYFLR